jgi:hypothetical protein
MRYGTGPNARIPKAVPAHGSGEEKFFAYDTSELPAGRYEVQVFCNLYENEQHLISTHVDKPNYHKKFPSGAVNISSGYDLKIREVTRHRNNKPDTYIKFKVKNSGPGRVPGYKIKYSFAPRSGNPASPSQFFSPLYDELNPGVVRQHVISDELRPGKWRLAIRVIDLTLEAKKSHEINFNNNSATKDYHKQ